MYGVYAWQAGATAANIQQDLTALLCGALIADLSASANKPQCSATGEASGWTVTDLGYGVLGRAGQAGGPGMTARIVLSAAPRIQVQAVADWVMGTHTAGAATAAADASLLTSAAGSVNWLASDAGLLIAASDWSSWVAVAECRRDGPALAGDAAAPGSVVVTSAGQVYMPRVKTPTAAGDTAAAACSMVSTYGALAAAAARNRSEQLYLPMVPVTVAYSSVPVGEVAGLVAVGGYAQSGDYVQDANGDTYQIAKSYSLPLGIPRR